MHRRKEVVFLTFVSLLAATNGGQTSSKVEKCIEYYKTGEAFDLSTLQGVRYSVYFWPPNQRQRDRCEKTNFRILSREEVESVESDCDALDIGDQPVMQSSYTNSAGKAVKLLFYGTEEVKTLYRNCDRISKYIFKKVNDDYLMGINCSSGGRGVLWSKVLPTRSEVNSIVEGIEIMSGREGSPDCELSRR